MITIKILFLKIDLQKCVSSTVHTHTKPSIQFDALLYYMRYYMVSRRRHFNVAASYRYRYRDSVSYFAFARFFINNGGAASCNNENEIKLEMPHQSQHMYTSN